VGQPADALGRDVAAAGLDSLWSEIKTVRASAVERAFLARLLDVSLVIDEEWADLQYVDADPIYRQLGLEGPDAHGITVQRHAFLGDLERKGVAKPASRALGAPNLYRPTYVAAVIGEQSAVTAPATVGQPPRRRAGRPKGVVCADGRRH
jgi:hypothetical protein